MVFVETSLFIIDNTGGYNCLCIGILSNSKMGRPGDVVLIAVKSILVNKKILIRRKKKVLKGTVRKCVLLRVGYSIKRWGNIKIKFSSSGVAVIGRWDLPVGSRIYGPICFEARVNKYVRIAMLAEGSF